MRMHEGTKMVFVSTTGRTGTKYLANVVNINSENATAEHDPYPRGYGMPMVWYDKGEDKKLERLSKRKIKRLERGKKHEAILNKGVMKKMVGRERSNKKIYTASQRVLRSYLPSVQIKDVYVESTHAFIKSFGYSMYSLRPDMYLIHLTRDPLEVAKSFLNRGSIPGPNNPFLLDPAFKKNILKIDWNMTDFQKCLWYWFENELRHREFVENNPIERVYQIDTKELTDVEKLKDMFKFFGITYGRIELKADRNKNKVPTEITDKDMKEAGILLEKMPDWVFDKIGDQYGVRERVGER